MYYRRIIGTFAAAMLAITFSAVGAAPAHATEDEKKIEFCHATGSESNPYELIETSVNAFYNAGHHEHQNYEDIVPPFEGFDGLNWDADGIAIFDAGCTAPVEGPEDVVVTPNPPVFEDVCGNEVTVHIPFDTESHYYTGNLIENHATVTAHANPGFAFPVGSTLTWEHEFTDEPCEEEPPVVTPEPPVVTPEEPVVPATPVTPKIVEQPYSEVSETLPETGVNWEMLPAAALLLAAGTLAVGLGRFRRRNLAP